jgi:hypothetical protein
MCSGLSRRGGFSIEYTASSDSQCWAQLILAAVVLSFTMLVEIRVSELLSIQRISNGSARAKICTERVRCEMRIQGELDTMGSRFKTREMTEGTDTLRKVRPFHAASKLLPS